MLQQKNERDERDAKKDERDRIEEEEENNLRFEKKEEEEELRWKKKKEKEDLNKEILEKERLERCIQEDKIWEERIIMVRKIMEDQQVSMNICVELDNCDEVVCESKVEIYCDIKNEDDDTKNDDDDDDNSDETGVCIIPKSCRPFGNFGAINIDLLIRAGSQCTVVFKPHCWSKTDEYLIEGNYRPKTKLIGPFGSVILSDLIRPTVLCQLILGDFRFPLYTIHVALTTKIEGGGTDGVLTLDNCRALSSTIAMPQTNYGHGRVVLKVNDEPVWGGAVPHTPMQSKVSLPNDICPHVSLTPPTSIVDNGSP